MRKIVYSDIQTVKLLYQENVSQLISLALNTTIPNNSLSAPVIYFKRNQDN